MFDEETKKILDSLELQSLLDELKNLESEQKEPSTGSLPFAEASAEEELVLLPLKKKPPQQPPKRYVNYLLVFALSFGAAFGGVGGWRYFSSSKLHEAQDNAIIAFAEDVPSNADAATQDIDFHYVIEVLKERNEALENLLITMQAVIKQPHADEAAYKQLNAAIKKFRAVSRRYSELYNTLDSL